MASKRTDQVKLGIFVLGGLLFLVVILYLIGQNKNMFGDTYSLKARFNNVQGLVAGNNVRYSGIQVGTVKRVSILPEGRVEVDMMIEKSMQDVIPQNAMVTIGTDGIVGNRVVNITATGTRSTPASPGAVLPSREAFNAEDMLNLLGQSNTDISTITSELRTTVQRINNSSALWEVLNSESLAPDIRQTLTHIRRSSAELEKFSASLNSLTTQLQQGHGNAGMLLQDTFLAHNLNRASADLLLLGDSAKRMMASLNQMVDYLNQQVEEGPGPVNALLNDETMVQSIRQSLANIEAGTRSFDANMEALKHNFLFRGYFRRQDRKAERALKDSLKRIEKGQPET